MPQKANRCPHCWAALSEYATDFCPHCGRGVATKQTRRRRVGTPEAPAASVAPAPPAPPAPPALYDYSTAAAPAAGAVAVAVAERERAPERERDPVEFPGTPLPPGFFDGLPEKVRKPKPRRIPVRTIGIGAAVALASLGGIGGIRQAADRDHDLSSPARHLVGGSCAEYRDFTTRLHKDGQDLAATEQAIHWFQSNVDRFAEAARLDPELAAASQVVTWFDGAIEAVFGPLEAMSDDEVEAFEEPLVQACYNGPGRA